MKDLTEAFRVIAENAKELERTLLYGWPWDKYQTEAQAQAIESTFHELGLHEPELADHRRWYLAGQIVARITRDAQSPPDR